MHSFQVESPRPTPRPTRCSNHVQGTNQIFRRLRRASFAFVPSGEPATHPATNPLPKPRSGYKPNLFGACGGLLLHSFQVENLQPTRDPNHVQCTNQFVRRLRRAVFEFLPGGGGEPATHPRPKPRSLNRPTFRRLRRAVFAFVPGGKRHRPQFPLSTGDPPRVEPVRAHKSVLAAGLLALAWESAFVPFPRSSAR